MTQEALRMAHKALIGLSIKHGEMTDEGMDAITAIEKALAKEKALQALHSENERLGLYKDAYAQPEQEPVNYEKLAALGWQSIECPFCGSAGALAFPQRTWVDLTRTQMQDVYFEVLKEHRGGHQMDGQLAFGEALQAKLKEKNNA